MKKIIIAIIHKNNQVLLVKRAREPFIGQWALPGGVGALEKEPDPEKAIIIEIRDDFGVEFTGEIYKKVEKQDEERFYFLGSIDKEPLIKSKETTSAIKWFDIKEAIETAIPDDQEILKSI